MPNDRKCTQCGNNGHNTRTCTGCKEFKLFGVQIKVSDHDAKIRKAKSTGNLKAQDDIDDEDRGYTSDGALDEFPASLRERPERKRGNPWTETEHRAFLAGLENLGKGDWKGISKNYVKTRTSSQVASHAQKYFIRLSAKEKKHRRASVFDIPLHEKNQQPQAGSTSVPLPVEKQKPAEKENYHEGGNLTAPTLMSKITELRAQDIRAPATFERRAPVETFERRAPVETFERPAPLGTRWSMQDLHYMAYIQALGSMQGLVPYAQGSAQGFVQYAQGSMQQGSMQRFIPYAQGSMPTVQVSHPTSYIPASNSQPHVTRLQPGSSQVNTNNNFFGPAIPQNFRFTESPATELQRGLSQAGSTSRAQNKNELNLNIGNLAI